MVLPHFDAAYNLARWLTRSNQDAEDLVQEACVRALRYFGGFRGSNSRAWLLAIVRNTFYSSLQRKGNVEPMENIDGEGDGIPSNESDPESTLVQLADIEMVRNALDELPAEFREVIVMRELEGLSYKEIADAAGLRMGTVMSRLARARERLQQALTTSHSKEATR